jgi:formate hydrogenlyase subunit 4
MNKEKSCVYMFTMPKFHTLYRILVGTNWTELGVENQVSMAHMCELCMKTSLIWVLKWSSAKTISSMIRGTHYCHEQLLLWH